MSGPTGSIGATLKDARAQRSISLEDVHAKIKIHPRVLQLLEENKFDKLPSPLFVKSFLRSYAEFLELNAGELIESYEKEGRKEPEQVLFIKPAEMREKIRRRESFDKKIYRVPLFIILTAGAVWGAFYFAKHAGGPATSAAFSQKRTDPKKSLPAGQTGAALQAKSDGWIRSVAQGNFPNLDKTSSLKLKVKALDNVWLRVTCDGKVLFQSILKRGSSEVWTATSSIEVWTGNSSNMALSLNGFSLGSPGRGVVKKLTVSHQGIKIGS